jgi:CubicO group peptidase (beta-lactamase class C family)
MIHAHFGINTYVAKHLANGHDGNEIVNDNSWDKKNFQSALGLYTEAGSYASFLIAIMEDKGLKKESFDEMLKEQVQLPEDDKERMYSGATEWGLGFGRKPSIYGINYIHEGSTRGYTSSFMINKEKKFGYVFFTNSNNLGELIHRMETFLTNGK